MASQDGQKLTFRPIGATITTRSVEGVASSSLPLMGGGGHVLHILVRHTKSSRDSIYIGGRTLRKWMQRMRQTIFPLKWTAWCCALDQIKPPLIKAHNYTFFSSQCMVEVTRYPIPWYLGSKLLQKCAEDQLPNQERRIMAVASRIKKIGPILFSCCQPDHLVHETIDWKALSIF